MAGLFLIGSKLQTVKSAVKEVTRMTEQRVIWVGSERWMRLSLERSRKTSVRDNTWGLMWMTRSRQPREDMDSSRVSSKHKCPKGEVSLAALWNGEKTEWHYKVDKGQVLEALAKSVNFIPSAAGHYWRILCKSDMVWFTFLKDYLAAMWRNI